MTRLAVATGLDPRVVADLDQDEFNALAEAVLDEDRRNAWTATNEALAAVVEALWMILARLEAGIGVVEVRQTKRPKDLGRYPRPDWIKPRDPDGVVVVTHVGDALRMMKGERR